MPPWLYREREILTVHYTWYSHKRRCAGIFLLQPQTPKLLSRALRLNVKTAPAPTKLKIQPRT